MLDTNYTFSIKANNSLGYSDSQSVVCRTNGEGENLHCTCMHACMSVLVPLRKVFSIVLLFAASTAW